MKDESQSQQPAEKPGLGITHAEALWWLDTWYYERRGTWFIPAALEPCAKALRKGRCVVVRVREEYTEVWYQEGVLPFKS